MGKLGFDIDGTFTDFDKFIYENVPTFLYYFYHNYSFIFKNKNGYNIENVFSIEETFKRIGMSDKIAFQKTKKLIHQFWYLYYFKYCMCTPFKEGVASTIQQLYHEGHSIYIYTSRTLTGDDSLLGFLARLTTKFQLLINGVCYDKIFFFSSDEEKIEAIKKEQLVMMVDDCPFVLNSLVSYIPTICVQAKHNHQAFLDPSIIRVSGYANQELYRTVQKILQKSYVL